MCSTFHYQSSEEIDPVHQLMTITSCSCSKCNSIACFTKRQPCQLNTYDAKTPRKYSFIDSISHSCSDLTLNKKEQAEKETLAEEYKENIIADNETHINPEKISNKQSQITFKTNSKHQLNDIQNNDLTNETVSETATNSYNLQVSSTTAKLSAQIMNVPYHDYEDSVQTLHKPETQPITLPKMSVFDVLEKIKEVYKACSCKVCECIGGKSQINEFCKCKPCDCDECRSSQKRISTKSGRQIPHLRSLCPRCKGDLCKVSEKYGSMPKCNCTQCECVHCADSMPEPCSCKLCQCIECKRHKLDKPLSHKELIVAAVGDDNLTQRCQCSPCECAECSHRVTTNMLRREISTEVNRHQRCRCDTCVNEACLPDDNDTCRCERRDKLMRKPVQRNNADYDIRRAVITQRINMIDNDRRDILTMFASISNRYSNCCFNDIDCSCDQSQCIKCNKNYKTASTTKSSRLKRRLPMKTLNTAVTNATRDCDVCNCSNCEKLLKPSKDHSKTKAFNGYKICASGCTEYDKEKNMLSANNIRDGVNYKCKRCVGRSNFFEFLHPIQKDSNLTKAVFEDKIHHSNIKLKQIENDYELSAIKSSLIPNIPKTYILNHDEVSFVDSHQLPAIASLANQCCFSKEEIPNVISSTIQTDNQSGRALRGKYNGINYSIKLNDYSFIESGEEIICKDERSFTSINNESIDEDYKRIKKKLNDFSQQLLQLLAKYEIANRDFKSISRKFQYPDVRQIYSVDKKPAPIDEDLTKTYSTKAVAKNGNKNLVYTYGVQENAGDKIATNVEPKQFPSILKDNTYKIVSDENVSDIIETSNKVPIKANVNEGSSTYSLSSYFTEPSEISLVDNSIYHEKNLNSIIEGNEALSDLIDSQIKRRIKGKVSKKHKQSSSISNQTKRFVPKNLAWEVAENDNRCNDLVTLNINKQSAIKDTALAKIKTVVPNTILGQQNVAEAFHIMKTPEREATDVIYAEETKPWPILKKTYFVKANPMSVTKGFRQPLEVGTKDATKTISWDNEVKDENITLVNAHSEAKHPLEKALLQRIEDVLNKINSEEAKSHKNNFVFEPKDSCESMKVRSLSVQRVSDHTVMVKWNAPRDMKNIRGYEMLVDGRPIQKVFNSSSSVAVVTCLANSKSMLLTVRTVTRSPCASGHCPSTTVLYKPRDKSKQD